VTIQAVLHDADGRALGWQQGSVMGLYLHGLFEDEAAMRALFGQAAPVLSQVMDGLANFIGQHLPESALMGLIDRATGPAPTMLAPPPHF